MTGRRYLSHLGEATAAIDAAEPGLRILVVPPSQAPEIAAALLELRPGLASVHLGAAPATRSDVVVAGLDGDATAGLVALNDARDALSRSEHRLVLLVTARELEQVRLHAPDALSAAAYTIEIPFVPDPSIDASAARAELSRWLRDHYGRLDLRGFARSEAEDVSWPIEEIYEPLEVEKLIDPRAGLPQAGGSGHGELREVVSRSARTVVLGHPGSGKSLFLRWLALRAATAEHDFGVVAPLPVVLPLATYVPVGRDLFQHTVETLLEQHLAAAHVLADAAAAGRVLFLLDGLDEAGDPRSRAATSAAVRALADRFPACRFVVTSRIAGYADAPLPFDGYLIRGLSDEAIGRFLRRWCRLYAEAVHGKTAKAAEDAARDSAELSQDVLRNPEVHELARTPLLLTVLAIVHRTGVRLPDHRVELYAHAAQVLVERWNRLRTPSQQAARPVPIRIADAVRLLGPIALRMIETGRSSLGEDALRTALEPIVAGGALRGIASAAEAIALFEDTIGLLVEQGPGAYAFLHLSFAEYFAARDLVRTNRLEKLARDGRRVFAPQWREVLLLAAGELGVVRAEDERLRALVTAIVGAAKRKRTPSVGVPSLLAGLLADDPSLPAPSAEAIVEELVPRWWFGCYHRGESLRLSVRLRKGRWAAPVRARLAHYYERLEGDAWKQIDGLFPCAELLQALKLDWFPLALRVVRPGHDVEVFPLRGRRVPFVSVEISRALLDELASPKPRLSAELQINADTLSLPLAPSPSSHPYTWVPVQALDKLLDGAWLILSAPT